MNDEQIRQIINGTYDEPREESIWSMASDFYSRKMLSIVIFIWVWAILFMAMTIYGAVQFFRVDQTKGQIMYATIFICGCQFVGLMKVFAWQMIHRNSIKREIKRLELRIAALAESLEKTADKG
ncbi:MAG: hypothetical protein AMJ65_19025 [Phycisphaerae bacterium SG8_4]|nr:MAG: hypothetical protein AMJ65_19025 [Phycisphaerae bacterium SG8_4]